MIKVAWLGGGGTGQNDGAGNDGSDGANDSSARNGGGIDGVNGGGGRSGGCAAEPAVIMITNRTSLILWFLYGDGCLCL